MFDIDAGDYRALERLGAIVRFGIAIALSLCLLAAPAGAQTSSTAASNQASVQTTQVLTDTNVTIPGQRTLSGLDAIVNAPSGGFIIVVDSATVPADGVVAWSGCFYVAPTVSPALYTMVTMANTPLVPRTLNGLSVMFSTGADCFHLVKAAVQLEVLFQ